MATLITQSYNLNMIPGDDLVVVPVALLDKSPRKVIFTMYDGSVQVPSLSGYTATIKGTRTPYRGIFSIPGAISGSTVSFTLSQTITSQAGNHLACVCLEDSAGNRISSANFIIRVY